jgi:uncharacterized protein YbbC (DUF1343 family)
MAKLAVVPLTARAHGMTSGELPKMFIGEVWLHQAKNGAKVSFHVVKMKDWKRSIAEKGTITSGLCMVHIQPVYINR